MPGLGLDAALVGGVIALLLGLTGTLAARAEDRDIRGALVLAGIGAAGKLSAVAVFPICPA
jgi:multisubunit Na+/H+ antiporter MnhB subunit